MNILTVNLLFTTLVFGITAKLYVLPRLAQIEPRSVVLPILLLHALRHLGLMFLGAGRCLSRHPATVHLPRGLRRFAHCDPRPHCAGRSCPSFATRAASGRALQCRRDPRPDRRNRARHDLRRRALYGAGLLDPGLLGPSAACHPLYRVRAPGQALVGADVTGAPVHPAGEALAGKIKTAHLCGKCSLMGRVKRSHPRPASNSPSAGSTIQPDRRTTLLRSVRSLHAFVSGKNSSRSMVRQSGRCHLVSSCGRARAASVRTDATSQTSLCPAPS